MCQRCPSTYSKCQTFYVLGVLRFHFSVALAPGLDDETASSSCFDETVRDVNVALRCWKFVLHRKTRRHASLDNDLWWRGKCSTTVPFFRRTQLCRNDYWGSTGTCFRHTTQLRLCRHRQHHHSQVGEQETCMRHLTSNRRTIRGCFLASPFWFKFYDLIYPNVDDCFSNCCAHVNSVLLSFYCTYRIERK